MLCPMKFHRQEVWADTKCEGKKCAWWNEYYAKCSVAVDAHLKSTEDKRGAEL